MAETTLDCYLIPSTPVAILLPKECVAAVIAKPRIDALSEARANWMRGYATWENQRLPVMSYAALHDVALDESNKRNPHLVVLNPIPDATRKAHTGLICYGEPKVISVTSDIKEGELPEKADRRYIETVVDSDGTQYIVPRLAALGVAFSYF